MWVVVVGLGWFGYVGGGCVWLVSFGVVVVGLALVGVV